MTIQNANKTKKEKAFFTMLVFSMLTSSLVHGSHGSDSSEDGGSFSSSSSQTKNQKGNLVQNYDLPECNLNSYLPAKPTIVSKKAKAEMRDDLSCYKRMDRAAKVKKAANWTAALALPLLGTSSIVLAWIPEPTGGTKIAAGVVGLAAIGVGAGCSIVTHKAAKIEKANRESISTRPTKGMITLERTIIQDKKKLAKLKDEQNALNTKKNSYENFVDSKTGLKKIWAKARLGYTKKQQAKVEKELDAVDSHCKDNENKWGTKAKNNALTLASRTNPEDEAKKYEEKLDLLKLYPINEYIKAMRQKEYGIILNALKGMSQN